MKQLILLSLCTILFSINGFSQRVMVGEKVPEIKVKEWGELGKPTLANRPYVIHFFLSNSKGSVDMLNEVNVMAKKFEKKLNVVLICRETSDALKTLFNGKEYKFYVGFDDDKKTFNAFAIQFVPYSVLVDAKGRVVWAGNSKQLTESIVSKVL